MLRLAATRGTPPKFALEADIGIVAVSGAESLANCRAGATESSVLDVAIKLEAGRPSTALPATTEVATRLGALRRNLSIPKSTPP
mmetsp:Transcript_16842/g.36230  ORF Transcript_16842/g.36230 Transcript_16842/m.36230 type:complete len:85 (-) Transcript_16842:1495-1749(-)